MTNIINNSYHFLSLFSLFISYLSPAFSPSSPFLPSLHTLSPFSFFLSLSSLLLSHLSLPIVTLSPMNDFSPAHHKIAQWATSRKMQLGCKQFSHYIDILRPFSATDTNTHHYISAIKYLLFFLPS